MVQKSQTTCWDVQNLGKWWVKLPFPQLVGRISAINSSILVLGSAKNFAQLHLQVGCFCISPLGWDGRHLHRRPDSGTGHWTLEDGSTLQDREMERCIHPRKFTAGTWKCPQRKRKHIFFHPPIFWVPAVNFRFGSGIHEPKNEVILVVTGTIWYWGGELKYNLPCSPQTYIFTWF